MTHANIRYTYNRMNTFVNINHFVKIRNSFSSQTKTPDYFFCYKGNIVQLKWALFVC